MSTDSALPLRRPDCAIQQNPALGPPPVAVRCSGADAAPSLAQVPVEELRLRHLRTPGEIAQIIHLREEIQLPAAALADPGFRAREKKETRTASWALLRFGAFSSAPSA
jgi:hypothetical protein